MKIHITMTTSEFIYELFETAIKIFYFLPSVDYKKFHISHFQNLQ